MSVPMTKCAMTSKSTRIHDDRCEYSYWVCTPCLYTLSSLFRVTAVVIGSSCASCTSKKSLTVV